MTSTLDLGLFGRRQRNRRLQCPGGNWSAPHPGGLRRAHSGDTVLPDFGLLAARGLPAVDAMVQTRMERNRTGPEEWLVVTRRPLTDTRTLEAKASPDATDQDTRYRYHYYLSSTCVSERELEAPSLSELARVIKVGVCIEASFKRGKSEGGMDEYQVRTWQGWHQHMALSLLAVWFLIGETHRGQ